MKIGDAPKTPPSARTRIKTSSGADRTVASAPVDETVLSGIPEAELTPRVRDALFSLMKEVQQLRAELAQAKGRLSELEDLADRDPLVDILNRRAFVRELDRALAMIDRYDVETCLVFIDLNDLKKINDEKGHLAGDAALKHVASILSANIRQTDAAGRLGGDEFGLLLTYADQKTAENKAQALAAMVSSQKVSWSKGAFSVSISYGAVAISKGASAAQAMERADSAMYRSKRRK